MWFGERQPLFDFYEIVLICWIFCLEFENHWPNKLSSFFRNVRVFLSKKIIGYEIISMKLVWKFVLFEPLREVAKHIGLWGENNWKMFVTLGIKKVSNSDSKTFNRCQTLSPEILGEYRTYFILVSMKYLGNRKAPQVFWTSVRR